jgi:hypothetical protein
LLQRALLFGPAQRAVQEQSLDFAQGPDHRFHRVPAQLLECRQALVAINDQVPVRLAFDRHHHDRRLLPRFGQRGQQAPLSSRMANPPMLPAPIQLVKLQSHSPAPSRRRGLVWTKWYLVLFARRGKCAHNFLGINAISSGLVLRSPYQECSHNPYEIRALDPELVLREVPGKLAQRSG